MKTAIATVTLSGSLPDKLQAAADAGFDAVEIFENDLIQFSGTPRDVRQIADDLGLHILALQPFRDLEANPDPIREQKIYYVQRKFEMMHELGTRRMLCCSNVSPRCINDPTRAAADLNHIAELAAKEGFTVGYEALAWGRHTADYENAWNIVKLADHPALGINLDTFHMFSRGNTLDCLRDEITNDKIALVQIADAPLLQMHDFMQYSRHFRCFPGQGDLPVVEFMQVLKEKGFDDYISHEIFNDEFRASSAKERAVDGMRSMIWLEEHLNSQEPEEAKPEVTDYEFIEFAIEGAEGDKLINMLEGLGFKENYCHVSKDVGLMQMNDINLVLNRERESSAHQHYKRHGASVCALAFTTSDAKGSLKRADRYRMRRFNNQAGPGELNIPAIKGIGDSLVYLVERSKKFRFYDIDFEQIEGVETADLGLQRVDHVAQSVSNTEFLSASFFYKSVLDFKIDPAQDLPDIYGLVTSRVASSPNGKVRLPINMTEARQASPQRFIQRSQGSGVQQIAFACEDIFKMAAQIGVQNILPIPGNYYRDIEARFQLPTEQVEKLEAANVLYDRNDDGEFFHCYTREVQGVFFEVVQRVGNYQGYGEPNAHIRFAAQAYLNEWNALLTL